MIDTTLNLDTDLRITEIFYSLQGETKTVGLPTVFVRLTGCPLRCQYCDTTYAFKGGQKLKINEILAKVDSWKPRYVTVTGGEPLAQKNVFILLTALCNLDYEVSLETSGTISVMNVDPRVIKVLDFKTPGSKEVHKNVYENVQYLLPHDQVKFVICHREDYEWSRTILEKYRLSEIAHILFSPSHGELDPKKLAEWILEDNLNVRLQLQLHKILWGNEQGR